MAEVTVAVEVEQGEVVPRVFSMGTAEDNIGRTPNTSNTKEPNIKIHKDYNMMATMLFQ